jgi:LysM repeat protein
MTSITRTSAVEGRISLPRAPARPRLAWILSRALVLLFILAALAIGLSAGASAYLERTDQILPGVWVGDVPLEGLSLETAAQALDRRWNQEHRITVVLAEDPARSWIIPPEKFGLRVDAFASAQQAFALGRGKGLMGNLAEAWAVYRVGARFRPQVAFDPQKAVGALQSWAGDLYDPPSDAILRIEDGEVIQAPGVTGMALDIDASLASVARDPGNIMLDSGVIPLFLREVQPKIVNVSAPAAKAERLLNSALELEAYDPATGEYFSWEVDRPRIASWLSILRQEDSFTIELDDDAMASFVSDISAELGDFRGINNLQALSVIYNGLMNPGEFGAGKRLLVRYDPTMYVVKPGDTVPSIARKFLTPKWKILEYNPQISRYGMSPGQRITIPPKDSNLSLPVVMDKRIVISVSEQHMWVYQLGEEIRDYVISTGMPGSDTLPGIFQVQAHYPNAYGSRWDLWMPHFMTIYQAPAGLENGIHGLPLLSSGVRLWANVLGQPASFGCVILDLDAAEWLYNWAQDGVVVEIQP